MFTAHDQLPDLGQYCLGLIRIAPILLAHVRLTGQNIFLFSVFFPLVFNVPIPVMPILSTCIHQFCLFRVIHQTCCLLH